MSHFEENSAQKPDETSHGPSYEELKLRDEVRDIFKKHAFDLKIYQYDDDDSYEDSFNDPSEVVLGGTLDIPEVGCSGKIELVSTIISGEEEIFISLSIVENTGFESRLILEEERMISSVGVVCDNNSTFLLDEDGIRDLRKLVSTADYSKQSEDTSPTQTSREM